jgi:SAM-dependent methyltransferase
MPDEVYSGVAELELLETATNYNRHLVDCICRVDAEVRHAVDFGAGIGTLALDVQGRGVDVTCIEPDAELQRRLVGRGLHVLPHLEQLGDGSQPLIYSMNVLEHIEDDAAVLRGWFRALQPGGRIVVYVPAFPVLYSQMDRRVGHVRRYRRSELVRRVEASGFQVERVSYADSLGFLSALVYKAIGSRGLTPRSIRLYDRWVFPLSRILDRVGLSRLFGKNLLLVARRPARPSSDRQHRSESVVRKPRPGRSRTPIGHHRNPNRSAD